MSLKATIQDRCRGIMLGLACGDALGAQVEFMPRDSFPLQTDFTGKGPHRLKPGQWTDDTAMALMLAVHIVDREDPHVKHRGWLADDWIKWMTDGVGSCTGVCFDIGTQTRRSLAHWAAHGCVPNMDRGARGNGALMRTAPVAIANLWDGTGRTMGAMRQAGVTHPDECVELCANFCNLLVSMVLAETPSKAIGILKNKLIVPARRTRRHVKSTGFDVHTFEAAVWAVVGAKTAEDAIIRAANLGDDADTVGAVAGALAGAVWGAHTLPERWLEKLAWREQLTKAADSLLWVAEENRHG